MPDTIELRTRDVNGAFPMPFMGMPQHGYYIHTMTNGLQQIIRAGPDTNIVTGNLVVDYMHYHAGMTGNAATDWITDKSQYRSIVLYSGEHITAKGYMDKIWEYGRKINQQMPDYKFPICDYVNLGMYNKCSQSNCNSFIQKSAEYAGLTLKIPLDSKGYPVWMPGLKSELRDTLFDNMIGAGGKYAKITAQKAGDIFDKYVAARADMVTKYQNKFKLSQAQDLVTKHADELIKISNDFIKWQNDKLAPLHKANDALRMEMQDKASTECTAQGQQQQDAATAACGPGNGVMVNEVITVTYSPMLITTLIERWWECKIQVSCDAVQAKYQAILDQATLKNNLQYQQDKADMQLKVNKQIDNLSNNEAAASAKTSMIAAMISEADAFKVNLCGEHGITHHV
jgi:hypothetical protein